MMRLVVFSLVAIVHQCCIGQCYIINSYPCSEQMGNELTRNCSDFDCEEGETHPGEPYSITYYRCPDDAEQVLNTEFNFHYPDDMSNTPQEFDGFESFKSELVGIYCRTRQDCDKAHTCLETGDLKCRTRGPVSYEYFSDYLITDGDQCEEEDDEQTPE